MEHGPRRCAEVIAVGRDEKRALAALAACVADAGGGIVRTGQHVAEGLFIMRMEVDLTGLTISAEALGARLETVAAGFQMNSRLRLPGEDRPRRLAILVSHQGSGLRRLIDDVGRGVLRAQIAGVVSNHETLRPVAEAARIPFLWQPSTDAQQHQRFVLERLLELEAELVVVSHYMQILAPEVVRAFCHRIMSAHPWLVPFYPGRDAYEQAWEEGVRLVGGTAHFVTEQLHEGPIIVQATFEVDVGKESAEAVRRRGLELEAELLSRAVALWLDDELILHNGKVLFCSPGGGQRSGGRR